MGSQPVFFFRKELRGAAGGAFTIAISEALHGGDTGLYKHCFQDPRSL